MSYITERDVRLYMMDSTAADHLLQPDIIFTSEDIADAMRITARKYNSIRPYVHNVRGDQLPDVNNLFFDGIAASLLEVKLCNLSFEDVEYSAGNVTHSDNTLKNLGPLISMYNERFVKAATELKITMNMANAFGQIG